MKKTIMVNQEKVEFDIISQSNREVVFIFAGKKYKFQNLGMREGRLFFRNSIKEYNVPVFRRRREELGAQIGHKEIVLKPFEESRIKKKGQAASFPVDTTSDKKVSKTPVVTSGEEEGKIAVAIAYALRYSKKL